jgi:hypothetical protein
MIAETRNVGKRLAFTGLNLNDFSTGPKGRLRSMPCLGFNRSRDRLPLASHSETLQHSAARHVSIFI